jgi:hypothetical protein
MALLNLAFGGMTFSIHLTRDALDAVPFCRSYFRGFFISDSAAADASVTVSGPPERFRSSGIFENDYSIERMLTPEEIALVFGPGAAGKATDRFDANCCVFAYCSGGILQFEPYRAKGWIFLSPDPSRRLRPLYRLLWMFFAQALGRNDACFVHGAALAKGRSGILMPGESGAGKSTVSRDCKGWRILSDDSPVFRREKSRWLLYPTPYHQVETAEVRNGAWRGMGVAEVKGVYFLVKDNASFLRPVPRMDAISWMLNRHILFFEYLPSEARIALFDFICEAFLDLPAYTLHFQKGQDAGSLVIRGYQGKNDVGIKKKRRSSPHSL